MKKQTLPTEGEWIREGHQIKNDKNKLIGEAFSGEISGISPEEATENAKLFRAAKELKEVIERTIELLMPEEKFNLQIRAYRIKEFLEKTLKTVK